MTRSYVTPVPPTPKQRMTAMLIVAHLAAGFTLALILMLARGYSEMRRPAGAEFSLFGGTCLVVAIVVSVVSAAGAMVAVTCLVIGAIDWCYRMLRWALTGVWVVRSEEIDEIESA